MAEFAFSSHFSDLTVVVEAEEMHCHSAVLGARSTEWARLLKQEETQDGKPMRIEIQDTTVKGVFVVFREGDRTFFFRFFSFLLTLRFSSGDEGDAAVFI